MSFFRISAAALGFVLAGGGFSVADVSAFNDSPSGLPESFRSIIENSIIYELLWQC